MTPVTFARERFRLSMYTTPPRTLKAHVGVWFSCFTHTSPPVRLARSGQAYCGVGGTIRCTSWAAASNSAMVKSGLGAPIKTSEQSGKDLIPTRIGRDPSTLSFRGAGSCPRARNPYPQVEQYGPTGVMDSGLAQERAPE